jgi:hypothetical protein
MTQNKISVTNVVSQHLWHVTGKLQAGKTAANPRRYAISAGMAGYRRTDPKLIQDQAFEKREA